MMTESEVTNRIEELWLRPDVVWLATRLRSDIDDERGAWPRRINIHIKFFRALKEAGCWDGVPVELASHGKTGRAFPRYVRHRAFLEWDIEAESNSPDGVWMSFTIFALVPEEEGPRLWCWICESIEEEEHAEALFAWWEPQSFAYANGQPLFPERFSLLKEY